MDTKNREAGIKPTTSLQTSYYSEIIRVTQYEMGHSHPGDNLQIAQKFNGLSVNISVGTAQILLKFSKYFSSYGCLKEADGPP